MVGIPHLKHTGECQITTAIFGGVGWARYFAVVNYTGDIYRSQPNIVVEI
jgi:hypothetical protein